MFARRNLRTKGFVVLYHAIPEPVTDHLRSLSREDQIGWVNETFDGIERDDNRFRTSVPDSTSRALTEDLERFYMTFFPLASVNEWKFLKTSAGAEDQPVRREFTPVQPEESLDVCSVPGSIFIALQDDTCFYGYGWNQQVAVLSDRRLIKLKKGDVLLFRGDFMFARAGYRANHVCVHAYLDTPLYDRPEFPSPEMVAMLDDTRFIDDVFCFVMNCPFRGTGERSLGRHLNRFHHMFFNFKNARPLPLN